MEYNSQNNDSEPVVMRERDASSNTAWYVVLGLIILGLIGWYGYGAGWFSARDTGDMDPQTEITNNDIINGDVSANAAPIDSLVIETTEGFPVQKVVVVKGTLPNGCVYLNNPVQFRDGNVFYVTLDTHTEGDVCTEALVPYEQRINLPVTNLPAGVYIVNVNGREITFELENDNMLDFTAGSDK